MKGFSISSKTEEMDIDLIHGFLADCYWSKAVPRQVVETAINNSLCFGVYSDEGRQIGFAPLAKPPIVMERWISDIYYSRAETVATD